MVTERKQNKEIFNNEQIGREPRNNERNYERFNNNQSRRESRSNDRNYNNERDRNTQRYPPRQQRFEQYNAYPWNGTRQENERGRLPWNAERQENDRQRIEREYVARQQTNNEGSRSYSGQRMYNSYRGTYNQYGRQPLQNYRSNAINVAEDRENHQQKEPNYAWNNNQD